MKKTCSLVLLFVFGAMVMAKSTLAANFTLNPASGSYDVGAQFDVVVGITTGSSKMFASDIWATFDASKLEMLNVVRAYDSDSLPTELAPLKYLEVVKTADSIDNNTGVMKISLQNLQSTSHDTVALNNQPILRITFRAKSSGTANFNFTCTQGSVNDSNIIDATTYEDIITCASNQSGLYTINSTGSNPTSTPVPTSSSSGGDSSSSTTTTTSSSSTTTTSTSSLPRTGAVEYTIGFGIAAVILLTISSLMFI